MPCICYEDKNFTASTLEIIEKAQEIIEEYEEDGFSLTLRQLYYQFVSRDLISNTERSYKRLGSIISDARRAGLIDWEAIEDRTRQLRSNPSWRSALSIIESAKDSFHIDLWINQPNRIEVWVEKDALLGVIERPCQALDVPYFSCRGYVSDSEMWAAGYRMLKHTNIGQEVILLHLGDHDPSGIDMTRDIDNRIKLFTGNNDSINVIRIALTMDQIREQAPPPNPAKITDSRCKQYRKQYSDFSWELDALEPKYIDKLIRDHVLKYRNEKRWQEAIAEQEAERYKIEQIIDSWDQLQDE